MFAASVTSLTAVSLINDTTCLFTRSNICCKPIRANHGSQDIAGKRVFRSGLVPVISSPVNEEDSSDFDSSCSTLSELENDNSPPQSQVPRKRNASVVVQRENPRGKSIPAKIVLLSDEVTPTSQFLFSFVLWLFFILIRR